MVDSYDPLDSLFREVLGLQTEFPLEDALGPGDVPGWDSLATMRLVNAAEERFSIVLELEDIAELSSVGSFRRIVARRTKGASP